MSEFVNKRKSRRTNCFVPIDGKKGGIFDQSQTVDLSKRGIGLISNYKLAIGQEIPIELDFNGDINSVLVLGRVIWSIQDSQIKAYRAGINFVDVLRGSKGKLKQFFKKVGVRKWI